MREIRFRAWDKNLKRMVEIVSLNFSEWSIRARLDDSEKEYEGYCERHSFHNEETDRFILLQFTGLKDKNGNEIFENDLIRDDAGYLWEVRFGSGEFYLLSKEKNIRPDRRIFERLKYLEIIGNIYEHPELVKP